MYLRLMKPSAEIGPWPELARLAKTIAAGRSLRSLRARIEHTLSQSGQSAKTPSITTISKILSGHSVEPANLEIFALGLGVDPGPLFVAMDRIYKSGDSLPDIDPLSLIGLTVDTSALSHIPFFPGGASASAERLRDGDVPPETADEVIPAHLRAIRVYGPCMEPYYSDGDIVFVHETDTASDGDVVIATVDLNNVQCKVYRCGKNSAHLEPTNGEGIIESPRFRIAGIVVGFYRPMKRIGAK